MNPTMKDIRECKVCGGKTRRCNYKGPRGGKCKNYRNCQDYRTCSYNEELQPCPHCNGTGYELIVTQRETNLSPDYVFCHISRKFRDAIFVNDEKLWVRIPLKIMVDEIVVVACDGSKVTLKVTDIQVKDNIITYIWGVKDGATG